MFKNVNVLFDRADGYAIRAHVLVVALNDLLHEIVAYFRNVELVSIAMRNHDYRQSVLWWLVVRIGHGGILDTLVDSFFVK